MIFQVRKFNFSATHFFDLHKLWNEKVTRKISQKWERIFRNDMQELLSPCVVFNLILLKTCQSGVGNQNFRFGATAEILTGSAIFRTFPHFSSNHRSAVILTEHNFWQKNTKKDSNLGFAVPLAASKESASPRSQIPLVFSIESKFQASSFSAMALYKQKSPRRMNVKNPGNRR